MYSAIWGMKYVALGPVSPWLPVLLVTEEGEFHLLSSFLWDHQVFLKKSDTEMISCVWVSGWKTKQAGLRLEPRDCMSQNTPCPGFLEAGGPRSRPRVRSLRRHCIPRQRGDTLAPPPLTPSLSLNEAGQLLGGGPEALRAVIFLAVKQGHGQDLR